MKQQQKGFKTTKKLLPHYIMLEKKTGLMGERTGSRMRHFGDT